MKSFWQHCSSSHPEQYNALMNMPEQQRPQTLGADTQVMQVCRAENLKRRRSETYDGGGY